MTATTNAKRANTRLFITFLICIVGALMLAPSALADDFTDIEGVVDDVEYVLTNYYDDSINNADDYAIFYSFDYVSNSNVPTPSNRLTLVYKLSDITNPTYQGYFGTGTSGANFSFNASTIFQGVSNRPYYVGYNEIFVRTTTLWTFTSNVEYWQGESGQTFYIYGNVAPQYVYIHNPRHMNIQYVQTSIIPPIDTTDQTYSDMMLMQYLHDNSIDVYRAHAWLITSSGLSYEIPISYDEPVNYTGSWYIKQSSATPYLDRFTPVLVGEYDPAFMHNSRFVIYYPLNCKKLTIYGLYDTETEYPTLDMYDALPEGDPTSANMLTAYPSNFYVQGRTYTGKSYTVENEENTETPIFIAWHGSENWGASIPHFNDLLVGIDITVTDENGNETISRNSTSYTTFVNNYNQQAISGLTGSITGRTSFSGDWRGQNVNTSITYNNNWTMPTDSNVQSLFSRVFTMGNGYVTTAVLGVLAIAFCAYVLYGKH